jgi:hypothetical protein
VPVGIVALDQLDLFAANPALISFSRWIASPG